MTEEQGRRKLKIDISELSMAMDSASLDSNYYLDKETGRVIFVTGENRNLLEKILEETPDDSSDEDFDLDSAINQLDESDWQKEALREANEVEEEFGTRYIEIPRTESNEAFADMEDFSESLQNQTVQQRLNQALSLNHPFRHFKDALFEYPVEQEQWYKFKEARQRERILEWLEDEGIEPEL